MQAAYSPAQRWTALFAGLICHALFAAAVFWMVVGLFTGLRTGLAHLHGWKAVVLNIALILQFAATHSLLLSERGRSWMARGIPLGLGRDLSTTVFAAVASIQLLMTFLFWSPTGQVWFAPSHGLKVLLTSLYAISWLLLFKSMSDAGLGLQTGFLGWSAVWSNRRPRYKPFPRAGMFRYSRQPIYVSFTLILWTAPVWTADHLVLAVIWTAYCFGAPVLKERRFLRYYGDAFARYRATVPYLMPDPRAKPGLTVRAPQRKEKEDAMRYDVIIGGAGPCGLLLANLLGSRGLKVLAVDKRQDLPAHSQAIGVTPPSLEILSRLGLERELTALGLPIPEVAVHGESGHLHTLSFRNLPGPYRHILSVPQRVTMQVLENNLAAFPNVTLRRGLEVLSIRQDPESCHVVLADSEGRVAASSRFFAACDGARSRLREQLRMRASSRSYRCHFVMGDFRDRTGLGEEAHVFFKSQGAVEAFPLPGGIRRWIVQSVDRTGAPPGWLIEQVFARTGIALSVKDQLNQTAFTPQRIECEQYVDGRVILCGDAAHVMSPIGGQGMNTGFADAEFLACVLDRIVMAEADPLPLLAAYNGIRRRAARAAASRAALGMWFGTWTGRPAAWLRDKVFSHVLFRGPIERVLGLHFAMLTIPCNTVARLPGRFRRLREWIFEPAQPAQS